MSVLRIVPARVWSALGGKKVIFLFIILCFVLSGCFHKEDKVVRDVSDKNIEKTQDVNKDDSINKNEQQKTEEVDDASSLQSEVLTKDWQTYRNEEYGFEFQYPEELFIAEKNELDDKITILLRDKDYLERRYSPITTILVKNNKNKSTLNQVITTIKDKYISVDPDIEKEYKIGNVKAYQIVYLDPSGYYDVFIKDDNIYEINSDGGVEKIISTFKFIDSDEVTADWQTYRNEEYGFEVKYPSDYYLSDIYSTNEKIIFDTEGPGSGLQIDIMNILLSSRINVLTSEQWNSSGVTEFNGINWDLFYREGTEMVPGMSHKSIRQYNNNIIEISLNRRTEELFNQILTTFKFID
jgi:hypothetical protein